MLNEVIPQLVNKLTSMDVSSLQHINITESLHREGINLRHLYVVTKFIYYI